MRLWSSTTGTKVGENGRRAGILRRPVQWFLGASLSLQFLLVLGLVLSLALASLAYWLNSRATTRLLDASAETAAYYLQNLLQPHVQTLAASPRLSAADLDALGALADGFRHQGNFLAIKIWRPDGSLIFAPSTSLVEAHPPDEIAAVMRGKIIGRYPDLEDGEHGAERAFGVRLYEIYAPLFDRETGKILAVGEFYQNADVISSALIQSAKKTWLFVAPAALAVFAMLFLIVRRGSLTIEQQNRALRAQFAERETLLLANADLGRRASEAMQNAARIDETAKRRLGAELHDGACQLLAFLALETDRLAELIRSSTSTDRAKAARIVEDIRSAAHQTMEEIRAVSRGLSSPQVASARSLHQVLEMVAAEHRRRNGAQVSLELDGPDLPLTEGVRHTIGRIVQEALNNAAKHAPGSTQKILLQQEDDELVLTVSDDGGSGGAEALRETEDGLGIPGMRFRAEALGGTLTIRPRQPRGTEVICHIPASARAS